jgi:hypothetical protein
VNSPEKAEQEAAQLAEAPQIEVPHYMDAWGQLAAPLTFRAAVQSVGEDTFHAEKQAEYQAKTKLSDIQAWGQEHILPKVSGAQSWLEDLPEQAADWTPPGRLRNEARFIGPILEWGAGVVGDVGQVFTQPIYQTARSWFSGEPVPLDEYLNAYIDPAFTVFGAKKALGPVHLVTKQFNRIPGSEEASDVLGIVSGVGFSALGAAGAVVTAKFGLPYIMAGLGGWALRKDISGVKEAVENIDFPEYPTWPEFPKYPEPILPNFDPNDYIKKEDLINYLPADGVSHEEVPDIINVPTGALVSGIVEAFRSDKPDTSHAGGGAAMMPSSGSKEKKKKKKKKLRHLELKKGRISPDDVRRVRDDIRTAESPSPTQSMGGGKRE